ncbi:MAG: hypothetical protein ABJA82_13325 [Myxococcales bacterium]
MLPTDGGGGGEGVAIGHHFAGGLASTRAPPATDSRPKPQKPAHHPLRNSYAQKGRMEGTVKKATVERSLPLPIQFMAAWIGDLVGRAPGSGDRVRAC